jgi:hypothetical protein
VRFSWRLFLVATAIAALALAACGGDDDDDADNTSSDVSSTPAGAASTVEAALTAAAGLTGGDAPEIDPCTLVTAAEIEAAVGLTVGEGSQGSAGECVWPVGPPEESRTVSVAAETVGMFNTMRSDTAEAVSDIGDEAYWMSGLSWLWVRQGEEAVSVQVATLQPKEEALAAAKTLANAALARR